MNTCEYQVTEGIVVEKEGGEEEVKNKWGTVGMSDVQPDHHRLFFA